MRADLARKIAPPTPIDRPKVEGAANLNQVKDSTDSQDIDFQSLLANSSENTQATRKAQKKGMGLSSAKSDQDFFDMLRKQTNQRPPPKSALDKDDFMKLFVAQLQNQNPLQPKEDADMAAQMAHFNSLEQMVNVNKKLEEMNNTQRTGQSIHLVNFVGKEITIDDGRGLIKNGNVQGIKLTPKAPVEKATLEVRDDNGQIVATQDLSSLKPGETVPLTKVTDKDGKALKDGIYTFAVKNAADPLDPVQVQMETFLTVKGIDLQQGGQFTTDVGKVSQEEVRSVGEAGFSKIKVDAKPIATSFDPQNPVTPPGKVDSQDKITTQSQLEPELNEESPNLASSVARSPNDTPDTQPTPPKPTPGELIR